MARSGTPTSPMPVVVCMAPRTRNASSPGRAMKPAVYRAKCGFWIAQGDSKQPTPTRMALRFALRRIQVLNDASVLSPQFDAQRRRESKPYGGGNDRPLKLLAGVCSAPGQTRPQDAGDRLASVLSLRSDDGLQTITNEWRDDRNVLTQWSANVKVRHLVGFSVPGVAFTCDRSRADLFDSALLP